MGLLRVGMGTTVLNSGARVQTLDGIGVYTQALLQEFSHDSQLSITEIPLRRLSGPKSNSDLTGRFPLEVMRSICTGLPFQGAQKLKNKISLFHAPDHYIPKLKSVPVVATLMDPIPLMFPQWANSRGRRLKNFMFRQTTRWAAHYITISQAVVPDLVQYFGIPEDKITAIHLGVRLEDFAPVALDEQARVLQNHGLSSGFFLFIGTLQPRKNLKTIMEAFSQLSLDAQKAHPLVVIGKKGWSCEEDILMLQKLQEKGVAHWLGHIPFYDKKVLLQSALSLLFPSLYEGFGLPIVEAFAARVPVITSQLPVLQEVSGGAALLVNPTQPDALLEAMQQIMSNAVLRQELIEKGYKRASLLTWKACAEQTKEVYKKYASN